MSVMPFFRTRTPAKRMYLPQYKSQRALQFNHHPRLRNASLQARSSFALHFSASFQLLVDADPSVVPVFADESDSDDDDDDMSLLRSISSFIDNARESQGEAETLGDLAGAVGKLSSLKAKVAASTSPSKPKPKPSSQLLSARAVERRSPDKESQLKAVSAPRREAIPLRSDSADEATSTLSAGKQQLPRQKTQARPAQSDTDSLSGSDSEIPSRQPANPPKSIPNDKHVRVAEPPIRVQNDLHRSTASSKSLSFGAKPHPAATSTLTESNVSRKPAKSTGRSSLLSQEFLSDTDTSASDSEPKKARSVSTTASSHHTSSKPSAAASRKSKLKPTSAREVENDSDAERANRDLAHTASNHSDEDSADESNADDEGINFDFVMSAALQTEDKHETELTKALGVDTSWQEKEAVLFRKNVRLLRPESLLNLAKPCPPFIRDGFRHVPLLSMRIAKDMLTSMSSVRRNAVMYRLYLHRLRQMTKNAEKTGSTAGVREIFVWHNKAEKFAVFWSLEILFAHEYIRRMTFQSLFEITSGRAEIHPRVCTLLARLLKKGLWTESISKMLDVDSVALQGVVERYVQLHPHTANPEFNDSDDRNPSHTE
eukprot:m.716969 g.716969  ORF g.716969 m.716969 type:complete len:601 (-) comp58799_c0_seq19:148-1950(-)